MISWQTAGGTPRRRAAFRPAPAVAAACLSAAWLLLLPVAGIAQTNAGPADPGRALSTAVALADAGEMDRAGGILCDALHQWPEHPELLAGLAGLRLRQGRPAEAEALAARLTRIDPTSDPGWELLAASRYLQDDTRGALRAWGHSGPPVVRTIGVRVLAHDGPRAADPGTDPARLTGVAEGRALTVEMLVRGERRLAALPAASHARLGYRALGRGDAAVEGTVVLGRKNPVTVPELAAHTIRIVNGRIRLVSSDLLGRLERWELSGTIEGTLHSASLELAHAAPDAPGVWRWGVDYGEGRYVSAGDGGVVRERRAGIAWSHADWVTASLRGSVHGRLDIRPERGTFAGAGLGWTFLSLTGQTSIRAEATGWTKVGGGAASRGDAGAATRFGRLALRGSLHPPAPPAGGAPSGVALRAGVVTLSAGAPNDLLPRIGAGSNTSLLMRARSDLDGEGVVRPLFPGRAWAHGGVELLRRVGSVGPVGLGVAAFADGVRVLAGAPGTPGSPARRGAFHLGAGARVRIPGVAGWLRVDWGIDPVDGTSTFSTAWVSGGPS